MQVIILCMYYHALKKYIKCLVSSIIIYIHIIKNYAVIRKIIFWGGGKMTQKY